MHISYPEFAKVEVRVGRVIRAEDFPATRKPAYRLWIDFGPEFGVRRSSAQLTALFTAHELEGRLVVAVTNLVPKRIADFTSEVLVLGVPDKDGHVVLLRPDRDVPPGGRVF